MSRSNYTPIEINLNGLNLKGNLALTENAIGMVIFSHGSGSSRLSPRNNFVAGILQEKKLSTLLFDLLTEEEDMSYQNRFNIDMITLRLIDVTHWVQQQKELAGLPLGYFGASTGAASALRAAAFYGQDIKAVVSRGGRPDLILSELHKVISPTLLIVGGRDHAVVEMNEEAYQHLNCTKKLEIVAKSTHLFEEPGKLEEVARLSSNWFTRHFKT
ncbi:alpha/beta hydrolase [Arenibacter aquaticus]|uniref:Alpha/beta hydrolase n=1 Tax=Arenibacter aquaticus TaxID=2489054 RepID=A0A430K819_9FLAO|nr:alpha/beta hydrolase [Arenibacter aquaticus]RTE55215.1 alpha/beta hydrolase [Arenibacter aquaticus]